MKAPRSLIIIPTYNEADNIGPLLERILREVPAVDVLVVDDNSPDGTRNIVKRLILVDSRVHILERAGKEGLGKAYIAGFQWAIDHGYDRMLQMDADFSHDPAYAASLLKLLDDADVAVGSRYTEGGATSGWSKLRELISRGGNFYARTVLGVPQRDLTGGFNAWRRETLAAIDFASVGSKGYAFQVELKYRAIRAGKRLVERPICFGERKFGTSKMSGGIVFEAALTVVNIRRTWHHS